MTHRFQPDARQAPADQVIAPDQILDISQFMNAEGELEWDSPGDVQVEISARPERWESN